MAKLKDIFKKRKLRKADEKGRQKIAEELAKKIALDDMNNNGEIFEHHKRKKLNGDFE